jgi:hypothetical protein
MMIDKLRRRRDSSSSMHLSLHLSIPSLPVSSGLRRESCSEMQVRDVIFDLCALHKGEVALELDNCYVDDVLYYIILDCVGHLMM